MNLDYTPEDMAFRRRAREWLAGNVPDVPRPSGSERAAEFDRRWQRKLYDGGWAGVNWPREYGGQGLSGLQTLIWLEENERAGAPGYGLATIALTHAGPTLIARGSDEQKRCHLQRILTGESLWCQGFSEPNAGSDLAAVQTRGHVDGDHIVINGQKTWTSGARTADYQELLIRSTRGSQRHAGLTWLICDMRSPGLEIRPIETMMGESEVNATFYDNVRIPLANVVGEIGSGWSVAMSTLAFERGTTFLRDQIGLSVKVERLIELATRTRLPDGSLAIEDSSIAGRLAQVKAEGLAHRAMAISNVSNADRNGAPGPEGSMVKLLTSLTHKAANELAMEILGLDALVYEGTRTDSPMIFDYLWGWVLTIAGGTTEIQREIIADRVLGLPRSR